MLCVYCQISLGSECFELGTLVHHHQNIDKIGQCDRFVFNKKLEFWDLEKISKGKPSFPWVQRFELRVIFSFPADFNLTAFAAAIQYPEGQL